MEYALDTLEYATAPFYEEAVGSRPPASYARCIAIHDRNGKVAGTGTRLIIRDPDTIADANRFRITGASFPIVIADTGTQDSPWTTQIQILRDTLGLPITALVEALNVTRPAFYDWLRGEQPNRSNQQRIRTLLEIADAWAQLNVGPMSRYWNVPTRSGGADLRATLISPDLSLQSFGAIIAKLGIGKRLLPPRTSKPVSIVRTARDQKRRLRRKAWRTNPPDAE